MRIRHLEVAGFGSLRDHASGPEELGDFVVVLGENEAGKTTMFEFLCSMLYGLYPTAADRHPYSPWDGAELAGTLRIEVARDTVEVTRRLRSSPSGTLVRGGRSESLRNDDLPFVSHISSRVFRQVYALGLADLASLAEEGWEAIQDRILGRLGAGDLRPAREVADELEAEARALWRPDRRGAPRVRRLDDAIRDAAARRPEVRQQSQRRRAAAERLQEIRRVLESARAARAADQELLSRLRRWVPIRAELARVEDLRRAAGEPTRLAGLTTDPVGELARRSERVRDAERHAERCRRELDEAMEESEAIDEVERRVLEHEGAIEDLRAGTSKGAVLAPRLAAAEQQMRSIQRRLEDESDQLAWSDGARRDGLAELPTASLTTAYRRWTDSVASAGSGSATPGAPAGTNEVAASMIPGAILIALGLAFAATSVGSLAAALGLGSVPAAYPLVFGGVLVVVGLWLWAGVRSLRRAHREMVESARTVTAARDREAAECRAEVQRVLSPFGLEAGTAPNPEFLPRLDRCRQLVRDRADLLEEVEDLRTRLGQMDVEAARLGQLLSVVTSGDAVATATLLHDRLARARERAASAARASSRLPVLREVLDEATAALDEARTHLAALEQHLEVFDAEDARVAAETAARSIEAHQEAERRWSTLVREHPDLDEVIEQVRSAEERGEPWITEADPLGALAHEIELRTGDIEKWVAQEKDLEAEAGLREGDETIDDLEGVIGRLRQERQAARREHDRLWILSSIVDRADREIRDVHQPAILRLAGEHLAALTGGRYDRLEVGADRVRTLRVSGPAVPGSVDVGPPLSTGTQEQIYVALRLALVDHLDDGAVRLPLFLDEVLVNWDAARRGRGLDLLETMTARRQVFLFTCHPHLAQEAVARGATRWRLDPT